MHEIFFQVFDKGVMEDGSGRRIDFKNTLILLTSNVGTDVIMKAAEQRGAARRRRRWRRQLRPALLEVFPPALLGRIVTIPYYPALGRDARAASCACSSAAIGKRIEENHRARFVADQSAIDQSSRMCNDPDSGGRVIDNIITNTILPALSREILKRSLRARGDPRGEGVGGGRRVRLRGELSGGGETPWPTVSNRSTKSSATRSPSFWSSAPDGQWAKVVCPRSAHESLAVDRVTEPMPPKDALSGAVKLANELKLAIVVLDPDGVWKKEWGELYRGEDDGEGEAKRE